MEIITEENRTKMNKIVIIKDDDRLWNCIIKVKNAEYSSLYKKLLTNKKDIITLSDTISKEYKSVYSILSVAGISSFG